MAVRLPLVVVLGATACGKSKLAIELAKRFNGEIISADSMQVYHGLDIVTNKVTEEEQAQAKHHLIDFLDPLTRFSVVDFKRQSLEIIGALINKQKLPIVTGGTNYYIESIVWKNFTLGSALDAAQKLPIKDVSFERTSTLIDREFDHLKSLSKELLHTEDDFSSPDRFFAKPIYNDAFQHVESEKLWSILEQVDPDSAHYFHPHDKRRLIRCLQIIQEKKRNYSEILKNINVSGDVYRASLGGPLRFENTCVLWLSCDKETLNKVQDERIDKMLDRGLLAELEQFHEDYNRQRVIDGAKPNYDKGIFQTIGFKEFHKYLTLPTDIKHTDEGNQILKKSIEELKQSTRKYANRQLKWIRSRFMHSGTRDLPALFKLDACFDESLWADQVKEPAFRIVESFIEGTSTELSEELLRFKQEPAEPRTRNDPGKYHCEACDRTFIGSHNIEQHLSSRTHQRKVSQEKRKRIKLASQQDDADIDKATCTEQ